MGIQKPLPFPVINGEQSSKAIKSISSLTDPLSRKKLPLETIMSNNGYARAPNITQQLAQKPEIEDDESSDSSLEPKKQLTLSIPSIIRISIHSPIMSGNSSVILSEL